MCSLKNFPPLPPEGYLNLCEIDGRIQTSALENANLAKFTNTVASYPAVSVNRDLLRSTTSLREDIGDVFLPVREPMVKKVLTAWYEHSLIEAMQVVAESHSPDIPLALRHLASYLLKAAGIYIGIRNKIYPHLRVSGTKLIAAVSQTRDWSHSPVRCLAWHPHTTKLAVAIRDDTVHIYTRDSNHKPFLKYKNQRNISSMAWRPLSASELAVACEAGVYVWTIDPNSAVTRLSVNCATFLKRPNHSPVTSVAWSPQGDILLTASAADTVMYVWNLAMESFSRVKKTQGGGVSFVSWSPDRLFAATVGTIFRVWETNTWTSEQWTLQCGHVKTACWSPCGSILLFGTSEEPVIYSLSFTKAVTVFLADSEKATRTAIPAADLTPVETQCGDRVGGLPECIVWDPSGQYVAVMFKECRHIAVFRSKQKPIFQLIPCCFINGISDEFPNIICFQNNYAEGALLTIAWSSGRIQYFPFINLANSLVETTINESFFSGHNDSKGFNNSTFPNYSFVSF